MDTKIDINLCDHPSNEENLQHILEMYAVSLKPEYQNFVSWRTDPISVTKKKIQEAFQTSDGTLPDVSIGDSVWTIEYTAFSHISELFAPETGIYKAKSPYKFRVHYKTAPYEVKMRRLDVSVDFKHMARLLFKTQGIIFFSRNLNESEWHVSLSSPRDVESLAAHTKALDVLARIEVEFTGVQRTVASQSWHRAIKNDLAGLINDASWRNESSWPSRDGASRTIAESQPSSDPEIGQHMRSPSSQGTASAYNSNCNSNLNSPEQKPHASCWSHPTETTMPGVMTAEAAMRHQTIPVINPSHLQSMQTVQPSLEMQDMNDSLNAVYPLDFGTAFSAGASFVNPTTMDPPEDRSQPNDVVSLIKKIDKEYLLVSDELGRVRRIENLYASLTGDIAKLHKIMGIPPC